MKIFELFSKSNVAILLCTFNGERFLEDQLVSLENQLHTNWTLFVSDDGSSDNTLNILYRFQKKWGYDKLHIRVGPRKNFVSNFLSLACDPMIRSQFYAFCDQDDIWLPTKLSVAVANISARESPGIPFLYCGRTKYVTENLKFCGSSPFFIFPKTFRNALVQSIAGGNTMVFNQATKYLLENVGVVDVASHDWWLYQLITGVDGDIYYDPTPQILYRQHRNALVGGNISLGASIERIWMLFYGRFKSWNTLNIHALSQIKNLLSKNNQETLKLFQALRHASFIDRLRLMEVCGLYRQTKHGTMSLFFAALINKI